MSASASSSTPLRNADFRAFVVNTQSAPSSSSSASAAAPTPVRSTKRLESYQRYLAKKEAYAASRPPSHRDRAEERRSDTDGGDGDSALRSSVSAENSKFLGGDVAHTHLVRGLDYALLAAGKAQARQAELLAPRVTSQHANKPRTPTTSVSVDSIGSRLLSVLAMQSTTTDNDLFLPKRMSFALPTSIDRANPFILPIRTIMSARTAGDLKREQTSMITGGVSENTLELITKACGGTVKPRTSTSASADVKEETQHASASSQPTHSSPPRRRQQHGDDDVLFGDVVIDKNNPLFDDEIDAAETVTSSVLTSVAASDRFAAMLSHAEELAARDTAAEEKRLRLERLLNGASQSQYDNSDLFIETAETFGGALADDDDDEFANKKKRSRDVDEKDTNRRMKRKEESQYRAVQALLTKSDSNKLSLDRLETRTAEYVQSTQKRMR